MASEYCIPGKIHNLKIPLGNFFDILKDGL